MGNKTGSQALGWEGLPELLSDSFFRFFAVREYAHNPWMNLPLRFQLRQQRDLQEQLLPHARNGAYRPHQQSTRGKLTVARQDLNVGQERHKCVKAAD